MTTKTKQERAEQEADVAKRFPGMYDAEAIGNLHDDDLKVLLRLVTREVATRQAQRTSDAPYVAVMIHGPNLRDQSKGQFHVHTAECKDNAKEIRNNGSEYPWGIEVQSRLDVVEEVYHDQLNEQPDDDSDEPGSPRRHARKLNWLQGEFHFAPCCKSIPTEVK